MNELKKNVFYTTVQQRIEMQIGVRSFEWEAAHLFSVCERTNDFVRKFLEGDHNDKYEILMMLRTVMLDVICFVHFMSFLKAISPQVLDRYNSMYVKENTVEALFVAVRNGLAHTIVGDGLLHKATKLVGSAASPVYYLKGRDALFDYDFQIEGYKHEQDVCFGCGFYRISIMNHLIPFLNFVVKQLSEYNSKHQGKKIEMPLQMEVLPLP